MRTRGHCSVCAAGHGAAELPWRGPTTQNGGLSLQMRSLPALPPAVVETLLSTFPSFLPPQARLKQWACPLLPQRSIIVIISTSQVQTQDGMGKGVPLVDGHRVGDPVTGVHHDASGAAHLWTEMDWNG